MTFAFRFANGTRRNAYHIKSYSQYTTTATVLRVARATNVIPFTQPPFLQAFSKSPTELSRAFHASPYYTRTRFSKCVPVIGRAASSSRSVYTLRPPRPPRLPQYSEYDRFQSAVPIYRKRIFWAYVGVFGGFFGYYYLSHLEEVPITNRKRFMNVSPKQEEYMTQQAYKEVMSKFGHRILPARHPDSKFVKKVAEKIIKVSPIEHLNWQFHVIASDEKNAFVLPGGKVFVFTGILPVTQNEDGLAAVLGHEIAHQVARHNAEKLSYVKILLWVQILSSFFIDPSLLNRLFLEIGILMPFSRKMEIEADEIGLYLMAQACYDPTEATRLWERMDRLQRLSPPQFLSTHPSHKTRQKKIQEWLPKALQLQEQSDCQHEIDDFAYAIKKLKPQWVSW
ncbi:5376_t:CDS:2 [Paraglomus brasilianum]|uniref:5376_t:CDS:1 n=1 Tax=Paraglomus brasilianum TaxID=144538 RepID=A0A9N9G338_9GLOM|nr:5376_t:CDS:2 [Paraglomus brasilianum]